MVSVKNKKVLGFVLISLVSMFLIEEVVLADVQLFTVRRIKYEKKIKSVTGAFSSGLEGLGNIGGTAHDMWGVVTVVYDSAPAWADDVAVKYYVLARDKKRNYNMLVGSTTYVSVQKGLGHMAHVFLHPNVLLRYGDIKKVTVEIWYKGVLITSNQWPTKTAARWWTKYKGIDGVLRHRFYTPFFLDYEAYEEAIKLPANQ